MYTFTVDLIIKLFKMKLKVQIGALIFGLVSLSPILAQESVDSAEVAASSDASVEEVIATINGANSNLGRQYFEGSKSFKMGGPACITCHNVNHKKLMPGGMFAKDLSDVYERMGEGITGWLTAPPFPAMANSYQNHELTEKERASLTAFFKEASENKHEEKSAANYFLMGGIGGLILIILLINILWWKRKRHMVKKDIFVRQSKAWDAKH